MIQHLFLEKNKTILQIGRKGYADNDIELEGTAVSRRHCSIEKIDENTFRISDLNSKNGTFVNGQLLSNISLLIDKDSTIAIGKHVFSIGGNATKIAAIHLEGLEKVFPNGNIGFHGLSLSVAKGDFVAIMGPSGCGKSTLLKAIAGSNPASLGTIKIDGINFYENYHLLKYQIGYVPQDDVLYKTLTVRQSLFYSYQLWGSIPLSDDELSTKIQSVLASVNITDTNILDRKIGDLSGGQRKRVAIATELLFEPKLLLLDEPTSPLDPETVSEFLNCLHQLSANGITILMVTHKPEDLHFASKALFMGTGGYTCFYGKTNNFLEYFKQESIIQVYALLSNEIESKNHYAIFNSNYQNTSILKQSVEINDNLETSYLNQLSWLTKRYFTSKLAQKEFLIFSFLQAPIIAILVALIFNGITLGTLFIMVITAIWFGVSNATREIADETAVYTRERMYGMSIAPYICSKIIVLACFTFLQIGIFSIICFAAIGNAQIEFIQPVYILACLFFTGLLAILLGLLLSAMVKSGEQAIAFMPMLLIPQVILAGIIHPIERKLVDVLSCFTISRWQTDALTRIQGNVLIENTITKTKQVTNAADALHLPNAFNIKGNFLQLDILVCLLLMGLFFSGIYAFLKKKDTL